MTILSESQVRVLKLLSQEKVITDNFYFGGGTVLAEYYLHHRHSEDLDFFCLDVFEPSDVMIVLKKIKKEADIISIRHEQSFNRNLFFLETEDEIIKTEFTYFPFERIEVGNKMGGIDVDSLKDIGVNKVFTIFSNPRSRDFIDLYCILQKESSWKLEDLAKLAQIKFDTYLNPVQLGAQYLRVEEVKDYPRMLIDLKHDTWQKFFVDEAKKLKKEVLK